MDKKKLLGNSLLLSTALIWGLAMVAQRAGMEYVGPLTFGGVRFWLAAATLYPLSRILERKDRRTRKTSHTEQREQRTALIRAGFFCGTLLFIASALQQIGLVFITAGKASFITALYIVIVPILGIFLKQRVELQAWVGIAIASIGLYMLTITETMTIVPGDLIMLIGSLFWALHVLAIDHFGSAHSAVKLAMIQFSVCAAYNTIGMFLFEQPDLGAILSGTVPILYAGILSGGVAFTLQIVGQRYTKPTIASLLLSMESVFGALFGFLILNEMMTGREFQGCVLMFIAIVISQVPLRRRRKDLVKEVL